MSIKINIDAQLDALRELLTMKAHRFRLRRTEEA
jgi:hypothetical protein